MSDQDAERLREHPRQRFAPSERVIDLEEVFEALVDEPHEAIDGHRQIAIDREGPLTMVAFHFQAGATLPNHLVEGAVTLQVLEGRLEVSTPEHEFYIDGGQILALDPGVPHDVKARRESKMMMTVFLAGGGAPD